MEYLGLAAIAVLIYVMMGHGPAEIVTELVRCLIGLRIRLVGGGRIVVVDGDTVKFRKRTLIGTLGHDLVVGRLRGIDAPERRQPEGSGSTHALRRMLGDGGLHLVVSCKRDVYDRELMWLVGWRGPVGVRMLWKGQAFATTMAGMPVAIVARLMGRGMWSGGRVEDPTAWRARNHHGTRW